MAKDIVDVALSQLGYNGGYNFNTKYGRWYGMNHAPWCQMFVSWCAAQAGISSSIVPRTASTSTGMAWFKKRSIFRYKGSYRPKRCDIIYFKSGGASHVGIVEYVSGNRVHTVEGNTSYKVARRSYPLSYYQITGYGTPKYKKTNASSKKKKTTSTKKKATKNKNVKKVTKKNNSSAELNYLKKILSTKTKKQANINASTQLTNHYARASVNVLCKNGNNYFSLPVTDLKITFERKGTPGKATFSAKYDTTYKLIEGNSVTIAINNVNFFYGFVFERSMSKDGMMDYVVYDQLRYLKNKDTLIYKKKPASEVIKAIARKFNMKYGSIVNTGLKLSAVEANTSLFDIIQNALDKTLLSTQKTFVLYDQCGKLTLKNISSMKVNTCLIDDSTAQDFNYKSSINDSTYNQIKLFYEDTKKGKYYYYIAKSSANINAWGVLQYTEKIDDTKIGKLKANALLKLYNRKSRTLSVSGAFGNINVRAGSLLPVILNIKDVKIASYMMVEKVTHSFNNMEWMMDLTLSGGVFDG